MQHTKRISIFIAASIISIMIFVSNVFAQSYDRSKLAKMDHKFTIGFERQVYTIYMPGRVNLSNKTRIAEDRCNRILFRMRLTNRFRLETGLSYKDIDRILRKSTRYNNDINLKRPCKLSIPLSIQYQLQTDRSRLHPYFGAGLQYFRTGTSTGNESGANMTGNNTLSNNLKYINIILTQGLIYDVTPDLQITQSIHILPEYGIKPVGINVGVGYRIK